MISKALFEQIPDDDWRKETWIAPEDAGKAHELKHEISSYLGIKDVTGVRELISGVRM